MSRSVVNYGSICLETIKANFKEHQKVYLKLADKIESGEIKPGKGKIFTKKSRPVCTTGWYCHEMGGAYDKPVAYPSFAVADVFNQIAEANDLKDFKTVVSLLRDMGHAKSAEYPLLPKNPDVKQKEKPNENRRSTSRKNKTQTETC